MTIGSCSQDPENTYRSSRFVRSLYLTPTLIFVRFVCFSGRYPAVLGPPCSCIAMIRTRKKICWAAGCGWPMCNGIKNNCYDDHDGDNSNDNARQNHKTDKNRPVAPNLHVSPNHHPVAATDRVTTGLQPLTVIAAAAARSAATSAVVLRLIAATIVASSLQPPSSWWWCCCRCRWCVGATGCTARTTTAGCKLTGCGCCYLPAICCLAAVIASLSLMRSRAAAFTDVNATADLVQRTVAVGRDVVVVRDEAVEAAAAVAAAAAAAAAAATVVIATADNATTAAADTLFRRPLSPPPHHQPSNQTDPPALGKNGERHQPQSREYTFRFTYLY